MNNKPYTTTDDLRNEAERLHIPLNGISYRDTIQTPLKQGGYIVNLDGKNRSGTHWVGLWIENCKQIAYFDSFGFVAPTEVEKLIGKGYSYNKHIIQDIDGGYCGQYVIEFLQYMNDNKKIPFKKRFDKFQTQFCLHHPKKNLGRLKKLMLD